MNTPVSFPMTTPGSRGERELQERYGTRQRAEAFYKNPRPGTAGRPPSLTCGETNSSRIDRIMAFLSGISTEVGY